MMIMMIEHRPRLPYRLVHRALRPVALARLHMPLAIHLFLSQVSNFARIMFHFN